MNFVRTKRDTSKAAFIINRPESMRHQSKAFSKQKSVKRAVPNNDGWRHMNIQSTM